MINLDEELLKYLINVCSETEVTVDKFKRQMINSYDELLNYLIYFWGETEGKV